MVHILLNIQSNLKLWLVKQAEKGFLPDALFLRAEQYLLSSRVILPGPTIIERLIISTCAQVHERMFDTLYKQLSAGIKQTIDDLLVTLPGDQWSLFYLSPPSATAISIKRYMKRYSVIDNCELDAVNSVIVDPAFITYLYKLEYRYSTKDIKRFKAPKRYSLMLCFLLETRKM